MTALALQGLFKKAVFYLPGVCLFFMHFSASALPLNPQIKKGNALISTSSHKLTVDQKTELLHVDWDSFQLQRNEEMEILHSFGMKGLSIHRVIGANPSFINGRLTAAGRVVLVNSRGIIFGPNSIVNVGALLATTSDILTSYDENLFAFDTRQTSSIGEILVEKGAVITARDRGWLALIAPIVKVQRGAILTAEEGIITLIGGNKFLIDLYGNGLVNFIVNTTETASSLINKGTLKGNKVFMKIPASKSESPPSIEQKGHILATHFIDEKNKLTLGTVKIEGGRKGEVSFAQDSSVTVKNKPPPPPNADNVPPSQDDTPPSKTAPSPRDITVSITGRIVTIDGKITTQSGKIGLKADTLLVKQTGALIVKTLTGGEIFLKSRGDSYILGTIAVGNIAYKKKWIASTHLHDYHFETTIHHQSGGEILVGGQYIATGGQIILDAQGAVKFIGGSAKAGNGKNALLSITAQKGLYTNGVSHFHIDSTQIGLILFKSPQSLSLFGEIFIGKKTHLRLQHPPTQPLTYSITLHLKKKQYHLISKPNGIPTTLPQKLLLDGFEGQSLTAPETFDHKNAIGGFLPVAKALSHVNKPVRTLAKASNTQSHFLALSIKDKEQVFLYKSDKTDTEFKLQDLLLLSVIKSPSSKTINFGSALALTMIGETPLLIVGAPTYSSTNLPNAGALFVYQTPFTAPTLTQSIIGKMPQGFLGANLAFVNTNTLFSSQYSPPSPRFFRTAQKILPHFLSFTLNPSTLNPSTQTLTHNNTYLINKQGTALTPIPSPQTITNIFITVDQFKGGANLLVFRLLLHVPSKDHTIPTGIVIVNTATPQNNNYPIPLAWSTNHQITSFQQSFKDLPSIDAIEIYQSQNDILNVMLLSYRERVIKLLKIELSPQSLQVLKIDRYPIDLPDFYTSSMIVIGGKLLIGYEKGVLAYQMKAKPHPALPQRFGPQQIIGEDLRGIETLAFGVSMDSYILPPSQKRRHSLYLLAVGAPNADQGFGRVYLYSGSDYQSLTLHTILSGKLEDGINPNTGWGVSLALGDGILFIATPYDQKIPFIHTYLFEEDFAYLRKSTTIPLDPLRIQDNEILAIHGLDMDYSNGVLAVTKTTETSTHMLDLFRIISLDSILLVQKPFPLFTPFYTIANQQPQDTKFWPNAVSFDPTGQLLGVLSRKNNMLLLYRLPQNPKNLFIPTDIQVLVTKDFSVNSISLPTSKITKSNFKTIGYGLEIGQKYIWVFGNRIDNTSFLKIPFTIKNNSFSLGQSKFYDVAQQLLSQLLYSEVKSLKAVKRGQLKIGLLEDQNQEILWGRPQDGWVVTMKSYSQTEGEKYFKIKNLFKTSEQMTMYLEEGFGQRLATIVRTSTLSQAKHYILAASSFKPHASVIALFFSPAPDFQNASLFGLIPPTTHQGFGLALALGKNTLFIGAPNANTVLAYTYREESERRYAVTNPVNPKDLSQDLQKAFLPQVQAGFSLAYHDGKKLLAVGAPGKGGGVAVFQVTDTLTLIPFRLLQAQALPYQTNSPFQTLWGTSLVQQVPFTNTPTALFGASVAFHHTGNLLAVSAPGIGKVFLYQVKTTHHNLWPLIALIGSPAPLEEQFLYATDKTAIATQSSPSTFGVPHSYTMKPVYAMTHFGWNIVFLHNPSNQENKLLILAENTQTALFAYPFTTQPHFQWEDKSIGYFPLSHTFSQTQSIENPIGLATLHSIYEDSTFLFLGYANKVTRLHSKDFWASSEPPVNPSVLNLRTTPLHQTLTLNPSQPQAFALFQGYLALGNPWYQENLGKVTLYKITGDNFLDLTLLTILLGKEQTKDATYFGFSLAFANPYLPEYDATLFIGAPGGQTGKVLAFSLASNTITLLPFNFPTLPNTKGFGFDIAFHNDRLIIGAPLSQHQNNTPTGAVYFYSITSNNIQPQVSPLLVITQDNTQNLFPLSLPPPSNHHHLGKVLSLSGDYAFFLSANPDPSTSTIHLLHYPSNAQPQFIDSYTFNAPLYDLVALPTKHLFLLTKDALLFASWQTQNGLQILKEKTFTEIPFFKKNSLQQYYTGAAQFYEKPSFAMDNIEETLFFLNPQGLYKIHYEHALPAAKPLSIAVMTTTKKLTPQTSSPIPLYVIAIGMKEQDKVYLLVAKQNAPKLWHLKHIIHGEKDTQFGTSVALSSQWLAVGATGLKTNNKIQGGAILYRLTETDEVVLSSPLGKGIPIIAGFSHLSKAGFSVAVSNQRLVIGAPHTRKNNKKIGAFFVYSFSQNQPIPFSQTQNSLSSSPQHPTPFALPASLQNQDASIGYSIALGPHNLLAVSAPGQKQVLIYNSLSGTFLTTIDPNEDTTNDLDSFDAIPWQINFGYSVTFQPGALLVLGANSGETLMLYEYTFSFNNNQLLGQNSLVWNEGKNIEASTLGFETWELDDISNVIAAVGDKLFVGGQSASHVLLLDFSNDKTATISTFHKGLFPLEKLSQPLEEITPLATTAQPLAVDFLSLPSSLFLMAIGKPYKDEVYILTSTAQDLSKWHLKFVLKGEAQSAFGASLSLYSNHHLAIGAPLYNSKTGAVYLYDISGTSPLLTQHITAFPAASQGGYSVDMTQHYLVIGAPFASSSPSLSKQSGIVYGYHYQSQQKRYVLSFLLLPKGGQKPASTPAALQTLVFPKPYKRKMQLGAAVSLEGDTLAVSALGYQSVYLYNLRTRRLIGGVGDLIQKAGYLRQSFDSFGHSLVLKPDALWVLGTPAQADGLFLYRFPLTAFQLTSTSPQDPTALTPLPSSAGSPFTSSLFALTNGFLAIGGTGQTITFSTTQHITKQQIGFTMEESQTGIYQQDTIQGSTLAIRSVKGRLHTEEDSIEQMYLIALGNPEKNQIYLLGAWEQAPEKWYVQQIIKGPQSSQFGFALDFSKNNILAIGAPSYKGRGAVFLYEHPSALNFPNWQHLVLKQEISNFDPQSKAGYALAFGGKNDQFLAIGAPSTHSGPTAGQIGGAVYGYELYQQQFLPVFLIAPANTRLQPLFYKDFKIQHLPNNFVPSMRLGAALAFEDDTLALAAPGAHAIYLYHLSTDAPENRGFFQKIFLHTTDKTVGEILLMEKTSLFISQRDNNNQITMLAYYFSLTKWKALKDRQWSLTLPTPFSPYAIALVDGVFFSATTAGGIEKKILSSVPTTKVVLINAVFQQPTKTPGLSLDIAQESQERDLMAIAQGRTVFLYTLTYKTLEQRFKKVTLKQILHLPSSSPNPPSLRVALGPDKLFVGDPSYHGGWGRVLVYALYPHKGLSLLSSPLPNQGIEPLNFGYALDYNPSIGLLAVGAPLAHKGNGQVFLYRYQPSSPDLPTNKYGTHASFSFTGTKQNPIGEVVAWNPNGYLTIAKGNNLISYAIDHNAQPTLLTVENPQDREQSQGHILHAAWWDNTLITLKQQGDLFFLFAQTASITSSTLTWQQITPLGTYQASSLSFARSPVLNTLITILQQPQTLALLQFLTPSPQTHTPQHLLAITAVPILTLKQSISTQLLHDQRFEHYTSSVLTTKIIYYSHQLIGPFAQNHPFFIPYKEYRAFLHFQRIKGLMQKIPALLQLPPSSIDTILTPILIQILKDNIIPIKPLPTSFAFPTLPTTPHNINDLTASITPENNDIENPIGDGGLPPVVIETTTTPPDNNDNDDKKPDEDTDNTPTDGGTLPPVTITPTNEDTDDPDIDDKKPDEDTDNTPTDGGTLPPVTITPTNEDTDDPDIDDKKPDEDTDNTPTDGGTLPPVTITPTNEDTDDPDIDDKKPDEDTDNTPTDGGTLPPVTITPTNEDTDDPADNNDNDDNTPEEEEDPTLPPVTITPTNEDTDTPGIDDKKPDEDTDNTPTDGGTLPPVTITPTNEDTDDPADNNDNDDNTPEEEEEDPTLPPVTITPTNEDTDAPGIDDKKPDENTDTTPTEEEEDPTLPPVTITPTNEDTDDPTGNNDNDDNTPEEEEDPLSPVVIENTNPPDDNNDDDGNTPDENTDATPTEEEEDPTLPPVVIENTNPPPSNNDNDDTPDENTDTTPTDEDNTPTLPPVVVNPILAAPIVMTPLPAPLNPTVENIFSFPAPPTPNNNQQTPNISPISVSTPSVPTVDSKILTLTLFTDEPPKENDFLLFSIPPVPPLPPAATAPPVASAPPATIESEETENNATEQQRTQATTQKPWWERPIGEDLFQANGPLSPENKNNEGKGKRRDPKGRKSYRVIFSSIKLRWKPEDDTLLTAWM